MQQLLLPLLFLLAIACQTATQTETATNPETATPHRFEAEIQAFETMDQQTPPPKDAILFVGSSSLRMWKSIETDLAPQVVLNRGFGGSTFADLLYFMDRVVLPYEPAAVVVYEGDNDIVADSVGPNQVVTDLQTFQNRLQARFPGTPVYILAIKPSIARRALLNKARLTNQLLQQAANADPLLTYIDVASPMMDEDGQIRSDIFIQDSLHMNAKGYEIWTGVVREALAIP